MYLKQHRNGRFQAETTGYLARLDVNGQSQICLVSAENDLETIELNVQ